MSRRGSGTREPYPGLPGAPCRDAYARRIASVRDHDARDAGASLTGLLVTLVVLGAIAAVVVMSVNSSTSLPTLPTTSSTPGGGGTTTTVQSITHEAVVAACVGNVGAVESAVNDYAIQHGGVQPPRGTVWAHPYVRSWPTSPYYAITWTGSLLVVRPLPHGRVATGSAGTSSPPTGCYAA